MYCLNPSRKGRLAIIVRKPGRIPISGNTLVYSIDVLNANYCKKSACAKICFDVPPTKHPGSKDLNSWRSDRIFTIPTIVDLF